MSQSQCATILIGQNTLFLAGLTKILSDSTFRVLGLAESVDAPEMRAIQPLLDSIETEKLLIIDASDGFGNAERQIKLFKERYSNAFIAVFTNENEPGAIVNLLRAGANACLAGSATCDTFIKSLELVLCGETVLPAKVVATFLKTQTVAPGPLAIVVGRRENEVDPTPPSREATGAQRDHDTVAEQNNVASNVSCKEGADVEQKEPNVKPPQLSARQEAILRYLIDGDTNKTIARKIAISEATVKVHVKSILRKIQVHNRTQAAIWALNHRPQSRLETSENEKSSRPAEGRFKRGSSPSS